MPPQKVSFLGMATTGLQKEIVFKLAQVLKSINISIAHNSPYLMLSPCVYAYGPAAALAFDEEE